MYRYLKQQQKHKQKKNLKLLYKQFVGQEAYFIQWYFNVCSTELKQGEYIENCCPTGICVGCPRNALMGSIYRML